MAKKPPQRLLTEAELELMGILWKLGEGNVGEVLASLPETRKLAYTSVSTILRILEQKRVVASRKEGRGHFYRPLLSKERYEVASLDHLVKKVFDGAPSTLVRRLIEQDEISQEELREIRELLKERLR